MCIRDRTAHRGVPPPPEAVYAHGGRPSFAAKLPNHPLYRCLDLDRCAGLRHDLDCERFLGW
eukprot:6758243-Alexandrium_andersonii.AAC.1